MNLVDTYGLLSVGDILSLIPILGSWYNWFTNPEGSHEGDYTPDISKEKCCGLGAAAAEIECIKSIGVQVGEYQVTYAKLTTVHAMIDAFAALVAPSAIIKISLIADAMIDSGITIDKIADIAKAGKDAMKKCKCALYI